MSKLSSDQTTPQLERATARNTQPSNRQTMKSISQSRVPSSTAGQIITHIPHGHLDTLGRRFLMDLAVCPHRHDPLWFSLAARRAEFMIKVLVNEWRTEGKRRLCFYNWQSAGKLVPELPITHHQQHHGYPGDPSSIVQRPLRSRRRCRCNACDSRKRQRSEGKT